MSKTTSLSIAIALVAVLSTSPTHAQDATDRALLTTFCDAVNIKKNHCGRANGYPRAGNRACGVALLADRFSGRFIASGNPLLVVNYESGCEARGNNEGGAVVFELAGGKYNFVGFQPGSRVNECITVPRGERQDSLVCLTGHIGQGYLEGGVALMSFTRDYGKGISISQDFLLEATDSTGAHGANVVTCKEPPPKYFGVSKLGAGPRSETVAVSVDYADEATISTACGKGFPRPKEIFGTLAPGDAWVPPGREKKERFIIDLVTRKVAPAG